LHKGDYEHELERDPKGLQAALMMCEENVLDAWDRYVEFGDMSAMTNVYMEFRSSCETWRDDPCTA